MKNFNVVKENGQRQLFDYGKLQASLRKVGINEDLIAEVLNEVENEGHDGMTTNEIYRVAYGILHKRERQSAIRYSLKKSVSMLGPTGFPFEKYVAEIFKAEGYETLTDQMIQGKCVEHEIDVVAWKEKELIMVEAKFHTDYTLKSDLKVVLYVKARYDDILGEKYHFGGQERKLTEGWLVTNTKFSITAIKYHSCVPGFHLVGWNYPYDYNLHHMIEKYELIPLTALTTITLAEKNALLNKGIVLAKNLLDDEVISEFNFPESKIKSIRIEVDLLCKSCRESFNATPHNKPQFVHQSIIESVKQA